MSSCRIYIKFMDGSPMWRLDDVNDWEIVNGALFVSYTERKEIHEVFIPLTAMKMFEVDY